MARLGTTWLWLAIAIAALARTRGRGTFRWFAAGLVLGPVALLILLMLRVLPRTIGSRGGLYTTALQDWMIGFLYVGLGLLGIATVAFWLPMLGWG